MGITVNLGLAIRQATASLGERLSCLFPASLTRAGLPPRKVRVVEIRTFPLTEPARAALALAGRGGTPVDVHLSRDVFLYRELTVPKAAHRHAGEVVDLQVRQSMPGQANGLVWRHVTGPGTTVKVFILKDAWLAELQSATDGVLRRVEIKGVKATAFYDASAKTDRIERFWNRAVVAFAGSALILVLAVQGFAIVQANNAVAEIAAQVEALREEATAARSAAEARSVRSAAQLADARRLMEDTRRLTLLSDLTRVLSDNVSLSSFALDGQLLRLSGDAGEDISDVVTAIRSLAWAEAVELDGAAAIETGSGDRRFQMQVTLKGGGIQ
jgi:Tfp pilus assembly protein PilN